MTLQLWLLVGGLGLVAALLMFYILQNRSRLPGANRELERSIRDVTEWRPPDEAE